MCCVKGREGMLHRFGPLRDLSSTLFFFICLWIKSIPFSSPTDCKMTILKVLVMGIYISSSADEKLKARWMGVWGRKMDFWVGTRWEKPLWGKWWEFGWQMGFDVKLLQKNYSYTLGSSLKRAEISKHIFNDLWHLRTLITTFTILRYLTDVIAGN